MEHPWIDLERNLVSAGLLLVWATILIALSKAPVIVKILAYCTLCALLTVHVRQRRLSYEMTFACVAASLLLIVSDPLFLPQTVLLTVGLLVLLTLCLFSPVSMVLLVLVFVLGITYSALFLLMVATHTDPALTGLVLIAMATLWMALVRPTTR
jgi:hypothetical protein